MSSLSDPHSVGGNSSMGSSPNDISPNYHSDVVGQGPGPAPHNNSQQQQQQQHMRTPSSSTAAATHNHTKRTRVLLSCASCRTSKLKCDRATPCSQCAKKGKPETCVYAPRPQKQRPAKSMAARLKRLEGK